MVYKSSITVSTPQWFKFSTDYPSMYYYVVWWDKYAYDSSQGNAPTSDVMVSLYDDSGTRIAGPVDMGTIRPAQSINIGDKGIKLSPTAVRWYYIKVEALNTGSYWINVLTYNQ
jgi:hypothetical protein